MSNKNKSARILALEALIQVEQGGAYSNLMLNRLIQSQPDMDVRDKRLMTEIVYGTIQHQRYIDFLLQPLVKKPIAKLDTWVRQLIRMSMYQIEFLDRVPDRAVVHEAVEIAKRKGHRGISSMVNGVLRNHLRTEKRSIEELHDDVDRLAVRTSHPTWLVKRWLKQYGWEKTVRLCEDNNKPPQMTIRVNRLKTTRDQLKKALENDGFQLHESEMSPDGLIVVSGGTVIQSSYFKQGYFTIQDESSMLVPYLLDPKPGMTVLDACAAPGGKTTHLAEYMDNKGEILAVDLHPHKENLVQENVRRLGTDIITTLTADARELSEKVDEPFDRILLDAPCSGFGVIRRKPDLKWGKTERDIQNISAVQIDLLSSVSRLLKPGGYLVYSTCTIEKEENQQVVHRFITQHPNYSIVENSEKQILPQDFGSDGFYMIKLQRNFGDS